MSPYPLRKILDWKLEPNVEPLTFPRSGQQQWHALMECGHKANWGAGPKPSTTQYRCYQCAPVEPEAA